MTLQPIKLLPLSPEHVDIWILGMDVLANIDEARMRTLLSPDELAMVDTCRRRHEGRARLAARALLRTALARYTGIAPAHLCFARAEYGKPVLADPDVDVSFNLSHISDQVVCAFARGRQVGVDVECIRYRRSLLGITDECMSAAEQQAIAGRPWPGRQQQLFEYWVLKESFVKATGDGLAQPLHRIGFHRLPGTSCEFGAVGCAGDSGWRSWLWRLGDRYRLAITVNTEREKDVRFRMFHAFPDERMADSHLPQRSAGKLRQVH